MNVVLKVTGGPHAGREFVFKQHEVFIVGRGTAAHFRLPAKDRYFSRTHFMIELNPPLCRLVDLGSRNGTYLNKEKVDQADLRDGDVIQGGQTRISVAIRGVDIDSLPEINFDDDIGDERVKLSLDSFIEDPEGESMLLSLLDDVAEGDSDFAVASTDVTADIDLYEDDDIESITELAHKIPANRDDDGPIPLADSDDQLPVYGGDENGVDQRDDEPVVPESIKGDEDDRTLPIDWRDESAPLEVISLSDGDAASEIDDGPLPIPADDIPVLSDDLLTGLPVARKTSPTAGKKSSADKAGVRCLICTNPASGSTNGNGGVTSALCDACAKQSAEQRQICPGFRLVKPLALGKLGESFLAVREKDSSLATVKVVDPQGSDPQEVQRLLRESDILKTLKNRHILRFYQAQASDGLLFLATEYVPGTPVVAHLNKRNKPLSVAETIDYGAQLLDALEYAHSLGIVHRDINPRNVLLAKDEGRVTVKLADFGLAWLYESSKMSGLTLTNDFSGTPAFLSPDQIVGFRDSKPAVDQYAAAATLYYMLTRQFVHQFPTAVGKQLSLILNEKVIPLRDHNEQIPERLARVIEKALSKKPEERYSDVSHFREALVGCS